MTTSTLEAAQQAIDRHAWSEAFQILSAQDASEELSPHALELLGYAAWWTSNIDACIDARERAYAAYMEQGDTARAAQVCLGLAEDHFHRLAESVGKGWLSRAESLLVTMRDTLQYGWLVRIQAVIAFEGSNDVDHGLELAQKAHEIGTRLADNNLQAISLHDQGRILVAQGQVEEGLALMEEAMVRAVGGELDPMVTGRIYCNMIDTCERLADYKRAYEWDEAARRWCDRVGHESGFPGICRVKRAEIMRLHGTWNEAEAEARRACEELSDFLDFAGSGFSEIGEIRMRIGDFTGAEEAFRQSRELGHDPEPGLAMLRLAQGNPETAYQLISQALEDSRLPLQRARLLPAHVEIALASGNTDAAHESVVELERVADEFKSAALVAASADAQGLFALHQWIAEEAVEPLHRAWKLWSDSGMPYEAARSRVNLGLAHRRRGAEELARLEMNAARSAFERLGAQPDAKRATELLRSVVEEAPGVRAVKALMFTDIVGSTSLIETIGDEAWMHLVRWHDRVLGSLFARHGGREHDRAGDGFLVVFPTASAAIDCAIDIQRSLHQHRSESGFAPQVRIGVHAAEVTEVSGQHTGVEVNKAARIASVAQAGEIVASDRAADGLDDQQLSGRRSVSLKGISEPVEIVTISWR